MQTQGRTAAIPDDTISIVIGSVKITGWQGVRITRGVERCPADFELKVTERFPASAEQVSVMPGSACRVMIGSDTIINGYVDRYTARVSASSHEVTILGRSKCSDLVDCSAVVENSQVGLCTPISLAQQLAAPFSISVAGNIATPQLPPFSVTLGETPFEIIEGIARYAGCLVFDGTDGNLVMTTVGAERHASGFSEGINIQEADVAFSMDDRFSRYEAVLFSTQNLSELGNGGNLLGQVSDAGVQRYRPLIIVSEQFTNGQPLALQRAKWEMRRRYGRSQEAHVICDGWRDSAGSLWTPNMLAPLNAPSVKLPRGTLWVITEVTFSKDENGTQALVTLMPPEALSVEPSDLQAYDTQLAQALGQLSSAGN